MALEVSTSSLYQIPRNAVAGLQGRISKAEVEVNTGQLADPAESLGSQLGLYQSLQAQSSKLDALQSSNGIVQSMLSASQNALSQIASDVTAFVSDVITAKSSGDFRTLTSQAQSLLSSFTSFLNSATGGAYLFGGTNSTAKPLSDYAQGAQAATAAAFQTAFGMSQSDPQAGSISAAAMQAFLTGPYASLFQGTSWSSNWSQASSDRTSALISPTETVTSSVTANESVFQSIANAYTSIADLGIGNLNASTQKAVLSNALSLASAAQQGIADLQATLGISQSQITNANSQMQTQATLLDNWATKLGGVDSYQAASTLTNLMTQLETAYSLTNRISKLGLVNYISA